MNPLLLLVGLGGAAALYLVKRQSDTPRGPQDRDASAPLGSRWNPYPIDVARLSPGSALELGKYYSFDASQAWTYQTTPQLARMGVIFNGVGEKTEIVFYAGQLGAGVLTISGAYAPEPVTFVVVQQGGAS